MASRHSTPTNKDLQYMNPAKRSFWVKLRTNWQLHLLVLPAILYIIIFHYLPMGGLVMAFQDFRIARGFFGSEWVGLKHFEKFFTSYQFKRVLGNTFKISITSLLINFPLPILFALILNILPNQKLKSLIQSITCIPHFISTVVVVGMLFTLLNPVTGLYGAFYKLFGGEGYPAAISGTSDSFLWLYVLSDTWQHLGWSSIIYMAALSGVDQNLYEAAALDGASRWKQIWTIDLPTILPTIIIMLILNVGSLLGVGFEKVFLMQTDLNLSASEVIATYVYKQGLRKTNNFSYGAAVGLFNSVVNCILLLVTNKISNKLTNDEMGLF